MGTKVKGDGLALAAIAAKEAGISYGRYMAIKNDEALLNKYRQEAALLRQDQAERMARYINYCADGPVMVSVGVPFGSDVPDFEAMSASDIKRIRIQKTFELWKLGLSDAAIAVRLDVLSVTAQRYRRGLRLPTHWPNRKPTTGWVLEEIDGEFIARKETENDG